MEYLRPTDSSELTQSMIAAENARFMSRVYSWMTFGVAITGIIAFQISQNADLAMAIVTNRVLFYGIVIAQLGAVIGLSMLMPRINSWTAAGIYTVYAALTGVTLSTIFLVYTSSSIAQVFALTACSFGGLSVFGFVTKRDLGPVASFCMMGLFGMVGFGLISLFFPSLMSEVTSKVYGAVGVVVFAGLTAYDTQRIKQLNILGGQNVEGARKAAIFGALTLYLDFVNLFLSLLRITGKRRN